MNHRSTEFLFLNLGHFLDHLLMLVFATVAALTLSEEWGMSYAELIPYATPGFVAFGVCALAAGWLADRWSREGMMVVFFIGIGVSAISASIADGPVQLAFSLTLVGVFAAIYHPVGLAMVVHGREKTGMALAVNGVWGNMGVACAALFTGILIDLSGWRSAFVVPGLVSVVLGMVYLLFIRAGREARESGSAKSTTTARTDPESLAKAVLVRVFSIIFLSTALGGLIFQSTTFALPRVLEEQLSAFAGSATSVGGYAFLVFSVAAVAQLVVGYVVDRHSVRAVFAVVALCQAVFFFLMIRVEGVVSLFIAIAFMLVVFGQIPINDVLVGRVTRSEWRSRAYAMRYIVTFTVMASAVPVIAWIHGAWGFDRLFALLALSASLIFAVVLMLPRSGVVDGR